jgi:hypothetical protein
LRGVVYFDGNPCAVDCLVRDISAAGARLEFTGPPAAASNLELQIPLKAQRHHCRIVWRSRREIGVAFAEAGVAVPPLDVAERIGRLEAEIADLKAMIRRLQREEGPQAEIA